MFDVDDLKIYRGSDIRITDKIVVTQPTIDQIIEFGEKRYFSTVHTLTGVGADFKWQLWDYFGIDYTQIDDFELFKKMICGILSSKKKIYKELKENPEQYEEYINKMTEEDWEELLFNPISLVLKTSTLLILKNTNQIRVRKLFYTTKNMILQLIDLYMPEWLMPSEKFTDLKGIMKFLRMK